MRIRSIVLSALVVLFAITLVRPAVAQDADPDRWGLTVAPYFVFPNMNGQTGIGDVAVDVDADPGAPSDLSQFRYWTV
jgi:hypothetical protein